MYSVIDTFLVVTGQMSPTKSLWIKAIRTEAILIKADLPPPDNKPPANKPPANKPPANKPPDNTNTSHAKMPPSPLESKYSRQQKAPPCQNAPLSQKINI